MVQKAESQISDVVIEAMRPENIGRRLTALRTALGKKKSEMADSLGVNRVYWSRFELGQRPVTNQVAAILYERYGVTMDWIIMGRAQSLPVDLAEKIREAEATLSDDANN